MRKIFQFYLSYNTNLVTFFNIKIVALLLGKKLQFHRRKFVLWCKLWNIRLKRLKSHKLYERNCTQVNVSKQTILKDWTQMHSFKNEIQMHWTGFKNTFQPLPHNSPFEHLIPFPPCKTWVTCPALWIIVLDDAKILQPAENWMFGASIFSFESRMSFRRLLNCFIVSSARTCCRQSIENTHCVLFLGHCHHHKCHVLFNICFFQAFPFVRTHKQG